MQFITFILKILAEIAIKWVISILLIIALITYIPNILREFSKPNSVNNAIKNGSQEIAKEIMRPLEEGAKINNERVKNRIKENEPRRIIGYEETRIPARSWQECVQEYGRGINELNVNVVKCQNGYVEKTPIYNK
ncbi:MAG TPA: hypothetical protein PK893_04250 [Candidatus Competibacteraceae bacterium]|nr:hypothetical protein [Candidatus Competibacteraceae bacterium]HQD55401.1 hypothetical protein [Candidatus Competibacteraceae bacterium]